MLTETKKTKMNMEGKLLKLHSENPDYVVILQACCAAHRRGQQEAVEVARQYGYDKPSWLGFEHTDVRLDDFKLATGLPRRLNILANMGFLEISFKSNSSTNYKVVAIDEVEKILQERERLQHKYQPTERLEIPDDLFNTIAGYDDIKALIKRALKVERFHILLCGSPASAKTLFLLELARLPGAFYCLGSATSKAGLCQVLFEQQPKILLADEIDKFQTKDIAILLSLAETGIVREVKFGKQREIQLKTSIFAAANKIHGMPKELLSRFRTLFLPEYSEEEFVEAATKVIIDKEKADPELALYIAQRTWQVSKDVREAIRISKICETKREVDLDIQLLKRYTERSRLI